MRAFNAIDKGEDAQRIATDEERRSRKKERKEEKKDGEAFLEDSVMTVATFPPCRKRIAPFPLTRKCGNKALPARGLEEVVTTGCSAWGERTQSVTFQ